MLIPNTLVIASHAFDGQYSISWTQKASVELIVRHHEPENDSQESCEHTENKEDNTPWLDGCAMFPGSNRDTITDKSSEDLSKAVEREPDTGTDSLFSFRVPLRSK